MIVLGSAAVELTAQTSATLAVAVVLACLDSPVLMMARRMPA